MLDTAVDALTTFATMVGVGASLGMGVPQINGGLNYLFGIPQNTGVQLVIIAVSPLLFLTSSMAGLVKGLKLLLNADVILAIAMVAVCVTVGPTTRVFNAFTSGLVSYIQDFTSMSTNIALYDAARQAWVQQ